MERGQFWTICFYPQAATAKKGGAAIPEVSRGSPPRARGPPEALMRRVRDNLLMGFAKRMMEDQLGHGFLLREQHLSVCFRCVDDESLCLFASRFPLIEKCDFCGACGLSGLPLETLFKYVAECLAAEWDDPLNCVGWEGGWIGASVIDSSELLLALGEPFANEGLREVFVEAFEREWCQRNPYGLLYHEALRDSWEAFSHYVKHSRRYLFLRAASPQHSDLFGPANIIDEVLKAIINCDLIRHLPAGSRLCRARSHSVGEFPSTAIELGSPSYRKTRANRMSPAGISMFYASEDEETALEEVLKQGAEAATTGWWQTAVQFPYLDLVDLPRVPSVFDMVGRMKRPWVRFIERFARDLAKPVEEVLASMDYVPTQVFTEAVRTELLDPVGMPVRGIRYQSSLQGAGVSWVLFVGPNGCSDDWTESGAWLRLEPSSVRRVSVGRDSHHMQETSPSAIPE